MTAPFRPSPLDQHTTPVTEPGEELEIYEGHVPPEYELTAPQRQALRLAAKASTRIDEVPYAAPDTGAESPVPVMSDEERERILNEKDDVYYDIGYSRPVRTEDSLAREKAKNPSGTQRSKAPYPPGYRTKAQRAARASEDKARKDRWGK